MDKKIVELKLVKSERDKLKEDYKSWRYVVDDIFDRAYNLGKAHGEGNRAFLKSAWFTFGCLFCSVATAAIQFAIQWWK